MWKCYTNNSTRSKLVFLNKILDFLCSMFIYSKTTRTISIESSNNNFQRFQLFKPTCSKDSSIEFPHA